MPGIVLKISQITIRSNVFLLFSIHCLYDFFSSIGQIICGDNIDTAFRQQLAAAFCIIAFQTDDDRYADMNLFDCTDDTFSDQVTAHDAAKDIHQHTFDVAVRQNNFKCFADTFFGRAAADIKKVGRFSAA